MKGNKDLDELIISYLLNELDSAEETYVVERINSDEETRKHFEKFRDTLKLLTVKQALDRVDINTEWKRFEQSLVKETQQLLPVKNQEILEENIVDEDAYRNGSLLRSIIISIAVAASVIAFVVMLFRNSSGKDQFKRQVVSAKTIELPSTSVHIRHEVNSSGKSKKLFLEDGSVVILFDKSELSFQEPFTGNTRDVHLKGKADFKVAKDKAKPFTVHSMDIATTALGTRFTITAFANEEHIIVRLFEGKVVIKSNEEARKQLAYDYYLLPGQYLVYNNNNYTAQIADFDISSMAITGDRKKVKSNEDLNLPENNKGSWNMFNNQSLSDVFEQLKVLYDVEIVYSKQQVRKEYFIGRFEQTDSLEYVLNSIVSGHHLKVVKKDSAYIITK